MRDFLAKYGSVVSALILTVLTLAVFALSRDRGPESTVIRFHRAVYEGREASAIRELTDAQDEAGKQLRSDVKKVLDLGAQVQLGRVYTEGRLSYVDVVYVLNGNRMVAALRYVVKKNDLRWQIDAGETNALRRQMFEFS